MFFGESLKQRGREYSGRTDPLEQLNNSIKTRQDILLRDAQEYGQPDMNTAKQDVFSKHLSPVCE